MLHDLKWECRTQGIEALPVVLKIFGDDEYIDRQESISNHDSVSMSEVREPLLNASTKWGSLGKEVILASPVQ